MEKNKRKGMMSEVTREVGLHITALINTSKVVYGLLQTYMYVKQCGVTQPIIVFERFSPPKLDKKQNAVFVDYKFQLCLN